MRRIRMWGLLAAFLLAASAPAAADVTIDAANFPDAVFRGHVKTNWDSDHDRTLSDAEIAAVDSADVHGKGIQSLKGIEHFTELVSLVCWNNRLTSLDVSQNKKLVKLSCSKNQLTALDVSKNKDLVKLFCSINPLTSLDVSQNKELVELYCSGNQLTSLDVSKNTKLVELYCSDNQLTSLDVSKNTALVELSCGNNQLTSLDVSKNTALVKLACSGNQLTALDVSKNENLKKLYCLGNRLTALDVSKNEKLEELWCSDNHLTSLDVSQNTKLKELKCERNRLTFLDLGGLGDLVPTSVDVGGQTRDGLKVRKIGSEYVVDLGVFLLSADRFVKVKALAGQAGSTDLVVSYDSASGRASFDALPDTVTYKYDTGKDPLSMDVRLTTELVSPDVPPTPPSGPGVPGTPPSGPGVPGTPPSGPGVPPTPPSGPGVPPVTSPVSPEPSSGGGGCDAGLSGLALALVGAFLLRKKV